MPGGVCGWPCAAIGGCAAVAVVPLLVVAVELEAQAHAVRAQVRVLVARHDSGVALRQFVAVAHQPEREAVVLDGGGAFHRAAPALLAL